jgi:hypothetical protein
MQKLKACLLSVVLLAALQVPEVCGQSGNELPVSPVLDLVSVDPLTGDVEIAWLPSPSPDVTGYVIYLYTWNEANMMYEGYELDTLYLPAETNYTRTNSASGYYSESFVITALDDAGNLSPFSNAVGTIYASSSIDTCNKLVEITWNSYSSVPRMVTGYSVMWSVNGSGFNHSETLGPDATSFVLEDFEIDASYCFIVEAHLSGERTSGSNKTCLGTSMQRPPGWINADYATVLPDGGIRVSFTIDPLSEPCDVIVEKRILPGENFIQLQGFSNISQSITYIDTDADITKMNQYRLTALNNCNLPVMVSNPASGIVLSARKTANLVTLSWNPYKEWRGGIDSYSIFVKTGESLAERYNTSPSDTVYSIPWSDLIYEAENDEICFMVQAHEGSNPYTISGESSSQTVCM